MVMFTDILIVIFISEVYLSFFYCATISVRVNKNV